MKDIRRGLGGQGLEILKPSLTAPTRDMLRAPIEEITPSREQPRTRFDDAALSELAASIKTLGVLEPILVRRKQAGGYEIIAGERRWRAAQRAGLREVPVIVRELGRKEAFEAALVENLQREDLNAIETARAFHRLVDEHGLTQDEVAARVGKDRATVANSIRLLKLPEAVQAFVENDELSEGHARAILGARDSATMTKLAREAVSAGWSVRETERRARGVAAEKSASSGKAKPVSANLRDIEMRLSRAMGARVTLSDRKGKGRVVIAYSSADERERILGKLLR